MLVFVDESGDSGWKIQQGSSRFFSVALVVFEENEDAIACDQRIQLLKKEIGWKSSEEFHFKRNSDRVRRSFLRAVTPYHFFYYGIVIDKERGNYLEENFKSKKSFYEYVCGLLFEVAKEKLRDATVVMDESGSEEFHSRLAKYLRRKANRRGQVVKRVKVQRSESNNLIQLADYIVGIISRVAHQKKFSDEYRKMLAHREVMVEVWPKNEHKKTPDLSLAGTQR